MKNKFIKFAACLGLAGSLSVISCKESFLDVTNPTVLSTTSFPNTVADLDLMLIDLYGRLRNGYFNVEPFRRVGIMLSHESDQGYNGSEFNEFGQNVVPPSVGSLGVLWNTGFESIGKCNSFLEAVAKIKAGSLNDDQKKTVALMEGQAYFLRAFNYFYLINTFGETPIVAETDKAKMGIPLWEKVPTDIAETNRERATQGAVWDFIIADFQKAETLLKGQVWDASNKPRVDEWAAKTFLGRSYIYTLQWEKGRDKLKEVIDQSGKKLVSYNTLLNMFNGQNEFNSESIFEINFTPDQRDQWNTVKNTASFYGIFISASYVEDDGSEPTNGFGNLFIHDESLRRFGFDDTTAVNQKRPDYIQKSLQIRKDKSVDPRLYIGTLQPYVDSIMISGKWKKVAKNRFEGFPGRDKKAWCHHKYTVINRLIWEGEGASIGINMYAARLADVYLLYAEALKNTGNTVGALEYVNKVHRRAYDLPVDVPSKRDYASLTARTIAVGSDDPLANDPLKYERWAELFLEGNWWFDVRRWKLGPQEAAYFKKVMSGPLVWNDRKYAMPLPTLEMNNNTKIVQNPGY